MSLAHTLTVEVEGLYNFGYTVELLRVELPLFSKSLHKQVSGF
jgi:hypothetical protein